MKGASKTSERIRMSKNAAASVKKHGGMTSGNALRIGWVR